MIKKLAILVVAFISFNTFGMKRGFLVKKPDGQAAAVDVVTPEVKMGYDLQAIINACQTDNVDLINSALQTEPTVFDRFDEEGFLPIHFAASSGSSHVIAAILDKKPEMAEARDTRGNIPFMQTLLSIFHLTYKSDLEKLLDGGIELGFLKKVGGEAAEKRKAEKYTALSRTLDLFIARKTNLEIPNNCGAKWDQIPGLSQELIAEVKSKRQMCK